jgi:uncharacterized membrane protein YccF (DUF307 family)
VISGDFGSCPPPLVNRSPDVDHGWSISNDPPESASLPSGAVHPSSERAAVAELWHDPKMEFIRVILNILWLVLSGIWSAIGYAIAGAIMFLLFFLIITIPFGIASFRLAGYALWPFGRTVVPDAEAGVASTIGNIIWFIFAGLWLAIGQFLTGLALCITIIGIPFGIANFKLARLSINPLGKKIVPVEYAEAERSGMQAYVPVR